MAPTYKNVPAVIATIIPSINGVAIFDINTPAVTPRGPDVFNLIIEVKNAYIASEWNGEIKHLTLDFMNYVSTD